MNLEFLNTLDGTIAARAIDAPKDSYTASLLAAGTHRIAQKVGEESVEVALAAVDGDRRALLDEAADLVYHLLVLLRDRGAGLEDLVQTLEARYRG